MLCSADVCVYVCVFVCVHNPHFLIFLFLHILHTYMFHIIKQILILTKISRANTTPALMMISYIKGKKATTLKKSLSPKLDNWLCNPWQEGGDLMRM